MPDILTGIITSDYQVRTHWGFMGFENAYWDKSKFSELIYPNMRVDIRHRRGKTISGYMLAIEDFIAPDFSRTRPKLVEKIVKRTTEKYPLNYIIATFLIPKATPVKAYVDQQMKVNGKIGVSIEHRGRKPKRLIGPFVTLCDKPRNKDCWIIYATIDGQSYPNLYPGSLPVSVLENAKRQYDEKAHIQETGT